MSHHSHGSHYSQSKHPLARWVVASSMALGLALLLLSTPAQADEAQAHEAQAHEAWEGRIEKMVDAVEADVHRIDAKDAPANADLGARLRGLDRRVSTIERGLELPARRAVIYEGGIAERRLSSWTNVAAQLKSRIKKASAERTRQASMRPASNESELGRDATGQRSRVTPETEARRLLREQDREPKIIQSYSARTNRTTQSLMHVPFAEDLFGDIVIQFQHEPDTVDVKTDDPADWSLERLLEEAKLLPLVTFTMVNESKTVRYGACESVELTAGLGDELVTIKGYALRRRTLKNTANLRIRKQIMQATWCPASPILCVRAAANAPQEGTMRASLTGSGRAIDGLLKETPIRVEGEVYDLFDGMMLAFDLDEARREADARSEADAAEAGAVSGS